MSKLFEEFQPISAKQWKQKVQFDLKGADYNKTLLWHSPEGIDVKPFYHADDSVEIAPIQGRSASWKICQSIVVEEDKQANSAALDALERGAESIFFTLQKEHIDPDRLLHGLDGLSIHASSSFLSPDLIQGLAEKATAKHIRLFVHTDILGHLARTGNWFFDNERDHKLFSSITKLNSNVASVDTSLYQNAGATVVQQLAYALAQANEYLNFGYAAPVTFNVSVGTNYFFEIAKLRALRWLWNTLASEYGISEDCHIVATPTKRNKTVYDYNTNLLRTTTEYMSAVLGGADTICPLAYDAIYHKENEFGSRIARNQLLILKSESYFDKVENPSDGAYYIESLTQQLAEKALLLFKDIEAGGGFLSQLKKGVIQRKIRESAQEEQIAFNNHDKILVGTNKYANKNDRMKDDLEIDPFVKKQVRQTVLEPIVEKRLSEQIEKERLATE